jgi:3-oxoadipate enol-lactonase
MSFESRLLARSPKIAVIVAGSGEALVFLHGLGTNKTAWNAQLALFQNTHFACAWDARGYGDSDDYEGALDFARDFTGDLAAVLDDLKVQKAHLVGLSMGGLIAQCFYFAHPERVATLVLAHTFPSFGSLGDEFVSGFVANRLQPLLNGAQPADLADASVWSLVGPSAPQSAREHLRSSLCALRKGSYTRTLQSLVRQPPPGALEEIAVPTLVLTGELDPLSQPGLARVMASRIRGSQFVIIPDCGHLSSLERPGAFNAAVRDFLTRHADRATMVAARESAP